MNENLSSNYIENDEFNLINEENDYKDLITRLNEIKSTIALLENEKRKFQRERFFTSWREWCSLENTQQAILPLIVIVFISSFIGWSLGISKNSCNPYFEPNIDQLN